MTAPLNWKQMVEEALRRRKQEGLTQREHAALANVSIPTMAAFERAETTLTLAKAFDVLRVVGLVDEPGPEDEHERFVREAMARWRELTETLPAEAPDKLIHGGYRFDYKLVGALREVKPTEFEQLLKKAEFTDTGWPLFMLPIWQKEPTIEIDGTIECKIDPKHLVVGGDKPANCDFWRASPSGSFFIMRGYEEDGQQTFDPATILGSTLPIWRMAEAISHAQRMLRFLKYEREEQIKVRFRAVYSGLSGRNLRAWPDPTAVGIWDGKLARANEVVLETTLLADGTMENLGEDLLPLISSLYERFSYIGTAHHPLVADIAKRFRNRVR